MAYLCYHLPRHPTPDLVGWKDLIWAGRRLSGTAGSLSTSFVGCIFRRPDSLRDLRAAPRRAVEPRSGQPYGDKHEDADRLGAFIALWALMLYVESVTCNLHVHTGRLKKFACAVLPVGRAFPHRFFSYAFRANFIFQGKIARFWVASSPCVEVTRCTLSPAERFQAVACGPCLGQSRPANLGESDPHYRYVPRIRDLSCLCVVRIWAHRALDRGLVFRHNQQGSQQRRGHALGVTAGSAAYLWASSRHYLLFMPRLRGLLGVRVTPRLHATNSPGRLAASRLSAFQLSSRHQAQSTPNIPLP